MQSIKEKQSQVYEALKNEFGYTNKMAAPRLEKVVISSGFGSARDRNERHQLVADRLAKITGQKPVPCPAKHSIASFKLREGEPIGSSVTLRGQRMYTFLDKLFHVAVPRMRDFRGFKKEAIDDMGNYTIGITEHTIFPETSDEELRNVFGMSVTLVTTAQSKQEAKRFFEELGVPFAKQAEAEAEAA